MRIEKISALRLVLEICRTGQLNSAASHFGLSVSAAARLLADARNELGDQLFNRNGHGMVATPYLKSIESDIARIIYQIDHLGDSGVFDPSEIHCTYRIGAYDNGFLTTILPVLSELDKRAPNLNLEIVPIYDIGHRLLEDLRNGQLDFAIYPTPPVRNDIVMRELKKQEFVWLVKKNGYLDKISKERTIRHGDLKKVLQIVPGRRIRRPWTDLQEEEDRTLVIPYLNSSPFVLLNIDGFVWMSKTMAEYWKKLGLFEIICPPNELQCSITPKLI